MPIDISERARKVGEYVSDQELDVGERLALARDLVQSVLVDLGEDIRFAEGSFQVAAGVLQVVEHAIDDALDIVG